jgi:uncharacterized membrane protein YeaQ/YmgE (transglycosylase-associated protein family)
MLIFEWFVEIVLHTCCGWIGHHFVKLITFGKVELEYGDSSESVMAEVIGAAVVLLLFFIGSWWIGSRGS